MGPDGADSFRHYWAAERLPFPGMADPDHEVARTYRQEVNLLKLGRMPLVIVIDRGGLIRFSHRGASMSDIPSNDVLLEVIDGLNTPSN